MKKFLPYIAILTIAGTILFLTENYEIEQEQAKLDRIEYEKLAILADKNRKKQELLEMMSDTTIVSLDLSNLRLNSLPDEIIKLKNLRHLNLSNNLFTHLPPVLSDLQNLDTLLFSYNHLKYFNTKLSNIKYLDLSQNKLKKLYKLHTNVPDIETLNISYNEIKEAFVIQDLPNLITLDISNNEITSLLRLQDLPNLRILNCNHNKIERIEYFPPRLLNGDFSNNMISNINYDEIGNKATVLELDFSHNQLAKFPYYPYFNRLQVLRLADNHITTISSFANFPTLSYLDVSQCRIGQREPIINYNFQNLRYLNLSSNSFKTISINSNNLTELDISHNEYLTFDDNSIRTPNLLTINIANISYSSISSLSKALQQTNLQTIITNDNNLCEMSGDHIYLRTELKTKPEIVCE